MKQQPHTITITTTQSSVRKWSFTFNTLFASLYGKFHKRENFYYILMIFFFGFSSRNFEFKPIFFRFDSFSISSFSIRLFSFLFFMTAIIISIFIRIRRIDAVRRSKYRMGGGEKYNMSNNLNFCWRLYLLLFSYFFFCFFVNCFICYLCMRICRDARW